MLVPTHVRGDSGFDVDGFVTGGHDLGVDRFNGYMCMSGRYS